MPNELKNKLLASLGHLKELLEDELQQLEKMGGEDAAEFVADTEFDLLQLNGLRKELERFECGG